MRERVPGLKKAGALWVACCPFHEERTPSFKVDPRRGTWRCYGACGTGGDQISFLQRFDNLGFWEALEILAARTGVELPRNRSDVHGGGREGARHEDDRLLAALSFAERFYVRALATGEGREARDYADRRGLAAETVAAFGLGYAPASGQALVHAAREEGLEFEALEKAGLARRNEQGRPYDFFRGRLVIPIRDLAGRPMGFGARRLAEGDEAGPKYVNTPETPLFHKGRLVYALDRALARIRRTGHIVLMEGYTDVMAAHQVGLDQCVAVLGTATTDDHAALIRRSGARRITLLFDGDEAGRKAAWKALHGLLPIEVAIDVVALQGGDDPCDVLVRDGSAPLVAAFELARDWFEFVCAGLAGTKGVQLSQGVDAVLELVARLPRLVQRESLIQDLAQRIGISHAALVEQDRLARRGARRPVERAAAAATSGPGSTPLATPAADPLLVKAWEGLLGALMLDASLVPLAAPMRPSCDVPEVAVLFDALLELYADVDARIDEASLLRALGDHPARERVVPIAEDARLADSPRDLLEGQLRYLERHARARENAALEARLLTTAPDADPVPPADDVEAWKRLYDARRRALTTS